MQLPVFDLTVAREEGALILTVVRWKAYYDPTKEWGWLPLLVLFADRSCALLQPHSLLFLPKLNVELCHVL